MTPSSFVQRTLRLCAPTERLALAHEVRPPMLRCAYGCRLAIDQLAARKWMFCSRLRRKGFSYGSTG